MNNNINIISTLNDFQTIDTSKKYIFDVDSLGLSPDQLFIALRNLELDSQKIILKIDKIKINQWLIAYIKTPIIIQIDQLNKLWLDILTDYLNNTNNIFVNENKLLIYEICCFLKSSIYYTLTFLNLPNNKFIFNHIYSTTLFNKNIFSLFPLLQNLDFKLNDEKFLINQYKNFFNTINKQYFLQIVNNSKLFILLYGKNTQQWPLFLKLLQSKYNLYV